MSAALLFTYLRKSHVRALVAPAIKKDAYLQKTLSDLTGIVIFIILLPIGLR